MRFIGKKIEFKNNFRKSLILSFWFALIFGVGVVSSNGGNPGIAFPVPVFISGIWKISDGDEFKHIVFDTVYPFLFWWFTTFILSLINRYFK